jgi:hypothetical protein
LERHARSAKCSSNRKRTGDEQSPCGTPRFVSNGAPYVPTKAQRHIRLGQQHPRHATAVRVQNRLQKRQQLRTPRIIESPRQVQVQDRQTQLRLVVVVVVVVVVAMCAFLCCDSVSLTSE